MKKLLNIYKPKGMTPLEVVALVKETFPEYKNEPIGYAGRLDPLAHGVLLLMAGEEATKQRDIYLNLPKEYEFEVLFGVATDTHDVLGLLETNTNLSFLRKQESMDPRIRGDDNKELTKKIESFINSKLGKQTQTYPPYSSKAVTGKPLHWWARNNKLSEIQIPEREIEIFDFKLLEVNEITIDKLEAEVMKQISSVKGDFRQKKIQEAWEYFFNSKPPTFITARFKIACSSGTYIRSLVHELGMKLGSGAITLEILRTKVGDYSLTKSINLRT